MAIATINPYTGKQEKSFTELSDEQLKQAIDKAHSAYQEWRKTPMEQRAKLMGKVAELLRQDANKYAQYPSLEMGKLLSESLDWEVPVCADIADYYKEHTKHFLATQPIDIDDGEAYIETHPVGVLLGVMPWNFPYYQVFRFVAPNLMAGNVCLIKHASNVPQCALALEELFKEAGFPEGVYTNLLISSRKVNAVIDDPRVRGVSLTGSEAAGSKVAERAGQQLKKAVMELGGSDPFIVLDDADIDHAVDVAVEGKMFNSGQCCAAAKRFILLEAIAEEFIEKFKTKLAALEPGDPMHPSTGFAPMVSEDQANEIIEQINQSVAQGAKVLLGGNRPELPGAFVNPTILVDIKPGMPAYDKEMFGPVANIFIVKDEQEAIHIANDTDFGLGSAICTRDNERAKRISQQLEAGMVYINTFTISSPELPFGGVKNSGFGRELSSLGIEEFVNKKLVRVVDVPIAE